MVNKPKEIKHLEVKEYELHGVRVLVKIDHDKEQVSLVERDNESYKGKQWIFVKREADYQQGWLNILEAMKYAIEQAFIELKKTTDRKEREQVALMRAAQKEG